MIQPDVARPQIIVHLYGHGELAIVIQQIQVEKQIPRVLAAIVLTNLDPITAVIGETHKLTVVVRRHRHRKEPNPCPTPIKIVAVALQVGQTVGICEIEVQIALV